jgi:hypothetical protein
MELCVLFDIRLDEENTFVGVQSYTYPIHSYFEDVFFDSLRVLVFRAKSMPGDNGIKTVALLL